LRTFDIAETMFAANLFSPTFCSAFGSRASSVAGGFPIEILKALKLESNSSKCLILSGAYQSLPPTKVIDSNQFSR